MYNNELKKEVHMMFSELFEKVKDIVDTSCNTKIATERIRNLVASKVATECEGYVVDMYAFLVERIKKDRYFQNHENLNAFYKLNLREELNKKYGFDITLLKCYKQGIVFKETNRVYATTCSTLGTFAFGTVSRYVLLGSINIPFSLIVVGAMTAGITTYVSVPKKNRKELCRIISIYLSDMEKEILDWLLDIERFFDSKIQTIYNR